MSNQEENDGVITGRAEVFYEVAKSIRNNDWLQFARRHLLLQESEIDDIQTNYTEASERKYQMILKWEQRMNGTPERLRQLRNMYHCQESAQFTGLQTYSQPQNTQAPLPEVAQGVLQLEETDGGSMGKAWSKLTKSITSSRKQQNSSREDICLYPGENFQVKHSTKDFYQQNHAKIDTIYKVKNKLKGYAFILCNINFEDKSLSRAGAEKDCDLMIKLFKGLGLQILFEKDLKMEEMQTRLRIFAEHSCHKQADMCVLMIMSHGGFVSGDGVVIYGIDSKYLRADKVIGLFNNDKSPNLINKPKMLFFQFCRGPNADQGVYYDAADNFPVDNSLLDKTDKRERVPTTSDVLVAWATQEGNLSFRCWFTNAIANVFSKHAHEEHVCDMLTRVKNGVAQRVSQTEDPETNNCKAMPHVHDTLRKKIYFFPGFP